VFSACLGQIFEGNFQNILAKFRKIEVEGVCSSKCVNIEKFRKKVIDI
jgi:hypothetical protein